MRVLRDGDRRAARSCVIASAKPQLKPQKSHEVCCYFGLRAADARATLREIRPQCRRRASGRARRHPRHDVRVDIGDMGDVARREPTRGLPFTALHLSWVVSKRSNRSMSPKSPTSTRSAGKASNKTRSAHSAAENTAAERGAVHLRVGLRTDGRQQRDLYVVPNLIDQIGHVRNEPPERMHLGTVLIVIEAARPDDVAELIGLER